MWLRAHDLRHTTLTAVERSHGHAVAKAFAGHADQTVTDGYVRATEEDVRLAHAHLLGEVVTAEADEPAEAGDDAGASFAA